MGYVVRPEDPVVVCSLPHLPVVKLDPFFEGKVVLVLCAKHRLWISHSGSGGDTVGWRGKCTSGVSIGSVKSKFLLPLR